MLGRLADFERYRFSGFDYPKRAFDRVRPRLGFVADGLPPIREFRDVLFVPLAGDAKAPTGGIWTSDSAPIVEATQHHGRVLQFGERLPPDGLPTDEDPTVKGPAERIRRFGKNDHVRLYALDDYAERLTSVGFRVELFDPYEAFAEEAARLRLNPKEVLPVGFKASP